MVDNLIRLFDENDTEFDTFGLGVINPVTCTVSEEINGQFELTMELFTGSESYKLLRLRRIVVTKANPYSNPQAFRIYSIETPIGGTVTVHAAHISYDLSYVIMDPTKNPQDIIEATTLKEHVDCFNSFSVPSMAGKYQITYDPSIKPEKEDEKYEYEPRTSINAPCSARGFLGNNIINNFKTELEFDNFKINMVTERGSDKGVVIAYGKNIVDLNQEENNSEMVTKVYPYYSSGDALLTLMTDPEYKYTSNLITILEADYDKIGALDLTSEFDEVPSSKELYDKALEYIKKNKMDEPKVTITVSFVDLSKIDEFKEYAALETVELGDTVRVLFEKFKITKESRVVSYEYNCIMDKYDSITIGEKEATLTDTMVKITSDAVTRSEVLDIAEGATAMITGNKGGYVVLYDKNDDGKPEEVLIMDTEDVNTATKVWRWNQAGLGYSNTGYDGNFGLAMTMDGAINCNFLKAGTIKGRAITGGSITGTTINNGNGTFSVSDTGALTASNANITGSINATSGTFTGTVYANSGSFTGDIKSGSSITCGSNFSVNSSGHLYTYGAEIQHASIGNASFSGNMTIPGTITMANGSYISYIEPGAFQVGTGGTTQYYLSANGAILPYNTVIYDSDGYKRRAATESWVQNQGYMSSLPSHDHNGSQVIFGSSATVYAGYTIYNIIKDIDKRLKKLE